MSLRSELKSLEEGLSITAPVRVARAEAFESTPAQNVTLAQRKAVFENFPYAPREVGQMGAFLESIETIRVRFTAYDANFATAVEIAEAFKEVFVAAIAGQRRAGARLNGTFENVNFSALAGGEDPFQSFAGRAGWELLLDFTVFSTVVFA